MDNTIQKIATVLLIYGFGFATGGLAVLHESPKCQQPEVRALIECDTDTDCMLKNGGDGGPAPIRRAL